MNTAQKIVALEWFEQCKTHNKTDTWREVGEIDLHYLDEDGERSVTAYPVVADSRGQLNTNTDEVLFRHSERAQ